MPQINSPSQVKSWVQWFERAAAYYKDPRMKMAYYQDACTGRPVSLSIMKRIYKDIWQKLKADKRHSLLEVGCGVGLFYRYYHHRLKEMRGTDISPKMIKDAYALNPHGKFFVAESHALPFPDQSLDRLLCYSVFHYFSNLSYAQKVLNEFVRVVGTEGVILIGDILLPGSRKKIKGVNSWPQKPWWPSQLNHQLNKLKIKPEFFKNYCRRKGLTYEILQQRISGRFLPETRYDLRITINKNEK